MKIFCLTEAKQKMTDQKLFYTPEELVQRYGGKVSTRTLANWRSAGISPPYCKIGGRILYRVSDIEEWERKRTAQSTSHYVKACAFLLPFAPLIDRLTELV